MLLAALGACVAGTYAAHAAVRGIDLERLDVEVDGTLDLHGYFQLDGTRAGFDPIRLTINVDADAPAEQLEELAEVVSRASPVFDSLSRGVRIDTEVRAGR